MHLVQNRHFYPQTAHLCQGIESPDITGSLTADTDNETVMDCQFTGAGALTPKHASHIVSQQVGTYTGFTGFSFSAKNSNKIYGKSSVVQVSACQTLTIIKA